MDSLPLPLLINAELQKLINNEIAKIQEMRRDLTRKYHEQIAELELAFRQKLYQIHLHTSSSQTQHEHESSRSLDSVLPERPGWCSLCEVDCNTGKDLKKHILGKKHQSKLNILKQDWEHPGWCPLCEIECNSVKTLKKHILGKKHQSNFRRLKPDSGFPEQPGLCLLCVIKCSNEKDLKKHILGNKHQSNLKFLKQDSGFPEQSGRCSLCEVKCGSEKDLEKHISGRKHQSKLKILKQESGEGNLKGEYIPGPPNICKTSSNSSQISRECADVDGREFESSDRGSVELKIVLESKDDGDLGANSNEDDLKQSA